MEIRNLCWMSLLICISTSVLESYFNINILAGNCILKYIGCVSLMVQPIENIEELQNFFTNT